MVAVSFSICSLSYDILREVFFLQLDQNTLAVSYAALILHDEGLPISAENINKLVKAANVEVESFWPGMFAKALQSANVGELISSVGSGKLFLLKTF